MAEALEETEDKEDQGLFGGAEADLSETRGGNDLEGAFLEDAAEVEAVLGRLEAEQGGP